MERMLSWKEIQKKYKDQWVAFTDWEENQHGDVTRGHVAYSNPSQKIFYKYLKEKLRPKTKKLASLYTGNVRGPFFVVNNE